MINLTKSGNTLVAVTLYEKTTISAVTPYYLFEFLSQDTNQNVYCTGTDISPNVFRYNLFNFCETGTTSQNLTACTINLTPAGYWQYNVYQMTGQTNTSLTGVTGSAIESGKMLVSGTSQSVNFGVKAFTGGTNQTRYVWNG